jgi:perosamine synthetase
MYTERLAMMAGVEAPRPVAGGKRSWFVYVVTLEEGLDRDLTMQRMAKEGIPTRGYFSPIHTQPYIRKLFGDLAGTLPVTEALAKRTLALPFHNHMTEPEIERVLDSLGRNLG